MAVVKLVQKPDNDDVREAFKLAETHFGHVPNLVRALGSNPAMCRTITAFIVQSLREGRVSWGFKELVILKTLRAISSFYGYGAHEALAQELGNSPERIGDIANSLWENSPHFNEAERAVFELVKQIAIDANAVPDELWDRLRKHWDHGQLVELDALITTFIMIGRVADTLGVTDPVLFKRKVKN
ncbi:MAG: carboxymuconolactone decarboxylase family protein [Gammaproteobacteria bacterium]|nr:carboxymuconolactone decarboxylase family protein [Gammaproteobacteria bacterium]